MTFSTFFFPKSNLKSACGLAEVHDAENSARAAPSAEEDKAILGEDLQAILS